MKDCMYYVRENSLLRLMSAVPTILLNANLTGTTAGMSLGSGKPSISWTHLVPWKADQSGWETETIRLQTRGQPQSYHLSLH